MRLVAPKINIDLDLARLPLTKLALYILSLPVETRKQKRDSVNLALEKSGFGYLLSQQVREQVIKRRRK